MGRRAPRPPAPAAAAACAGVALSLLLLAAGARASPVSYGSEVALGAGLGCCGEVCDLATGRCECLAAEVDAEAATASPDSACRCCEVSTYGGRRAGRSGGLTKKKASKVAEAPEVRRRGPRSPRLPPPRL